MNPLIGVGSGDKTPGSVACIPFVGDCSKNGGVVEILTCMGFSSGVGFWSWTGCEMDGCRECGAEDVCEGAFACCGCPFVAFANC